MVAESQTGVRNRAGSTVNMLSMGRIASTGYVVLSDLGIFNGTDTNTDTNTQNDGCDSQGEMLDDTSSKFATWAILQDVGEGSFFGTEIPTATVTTTGGLP